MLGGTPPDCLDNRDHLSGQPLTTRRYSGRPFSADELALVAAFAADHRQYPTRAAIARAVCAHLHWFQPDGGSRSPPRRNDVTVPPGSHWQGRGALPSNTARATDDRRGFPARTRPIQNRGASGGPVYSSIPWMLAGTPAGPAPPERLGPRLHAVPPPANPAALGPGCLAPLPLRCYAAPSRAVRQPFAASPMPAVSLGVCDHQPSPFVILGAPLRTGPGAAACAVGLS